MESQLDEIANKLGIDPIALRQQNLITAADEILIGREEHFHIIGSYALGECLDKVTEALDYQPGQPPVVDGHLRRGVGFAVTMQASGLAKLHSANVKLSVQPDGRYELRTGAVDVGTGSDTTLRQIAAHVLGTTVTEIDLVASDTHHTPFDSGSYASATAFISGQAVNLAAQKLRSHILEVAAKMMQVEADELTLAHQIHSSTQTLTLQQLVQAAQAQGDTLEAIDFEHSSDQSSLTFAVLGVEVEVDTETGRITVLRCAEAIDIGKSN